MNHAVFHGSVMVSGFVAVAQMWFPLEPFGHWRDGFLQCSGCLRVF